jgi:hypothetical protein
VVEGFTLGWLPQIIQGNNTLQLIYFGCCQRGFGRASAAWQ